eukprot:GHVP01042482.1.p1 GENE.GHVP01042482.1~~GHVP01042482.1.p1  ORF type:complete len:469 (-),score=84.11 GHVP01042482.1:150-1556(-)
MGNEPSQPVCTKMVANEKAGVLRFGVSEMQGWRESMEDSFVASVVKSHDLPHDAEFAVFGVFDGHGGGHVARFVAHHMVAHIINSESFANGTLDESIRDAFNSIDRLLAHENAKEELIMWESMPYEDYQTDYSPVGEIVSPVPTKKNALSQRLPVTVAELPDHTLVRFAPFVCGEETGGRASHHRCVFDSNSEKILVEDLTLKNLNNAENDEVQEQEVSGRNWSWIPSKLKSIFRKPSGLRPAQFYENYNNQNLLPLTNHAALTGCTGVVAVVTDTQIIVGNAGDSRCVLCRRGRAIELSQDHKPHLPGEKARILGAGGFIEIGRVNGNLNLSRALGDLVYKQDLSRYSEEQIVTSCPDVHVIDKMEDDDEFLIIGCDGIWDSMSSQQVVDFLSSRIDKCDQLSHALDMLLDALLSPNPALVEVGCDNMTAVLVDLRSDRNVPEKPQDIRKFNVEEFSNAFGVEMVDM